ncbi:uncharacterized protein LOC110716664 [Chenopodium quinoa]|uniref:uncharacterized protein LOC110716664 n=1 Tax=Chenopodium quinoa TaxID=63459 RepID=UPI000B7959D1|nr:uncharacterized protein LOC110716664 [Chenopodium quinoa]
MGFKDPDKPDHVCLLEKSLYGLKQAPRAWYKRFADFVATIGFANRKSDTSLFIYRHGNDIAYLLLYVDDVMLTASSESLRRHIISRLSSEFAMKDLGPLSYFLGIAVTRGKNGLFLSQKKYAQEILEKAGMYLTFTRPDNSYAVQQVCLFMHSPHVEHMDALKSILRYIRGTTNFGLQLHKSPVSSLVSYTDADWGRYPDTRRSTSGYCVYLGDNLISWSSKRQPTLSKSICEVEYRGVANVVSESCWISYFEGNNGLL